MHEYSLTTALVETCLEAIQNNVNQVVEVEIKVGIFALVVYEQLEFWFEFLSKDTPLEGAKIIFHEEAGEILCQECQKISSVLSSPQVALDIPLFECEYCKSTQTRILSGQDIIISKLQVIDEPDIYQG
ncbi:MAG: hydrogenase maturation nickel metallochaperone HypA/HybF [Candidatus Hodarchaeales archaeon]|jgi:hydrogenase nickel incorporation protein HypA/HybF